MKAKMHTHRVAWALPAGLVLLLVPVAVALAAGNIDPDDKWAWGTNVGWFNFSPEYGGVTVYSDHLEGYAWGENIGWIRLGTCTGGSPCTHANTSVTDYGVNNDGAGNLSGYAWSTNAGWINFDPDGDEGVTIDPLTGDFDGYAWGENVGWIHFQNAAPAYKVNTTWRPSAPVADAGPDQSVDTLALVTLDGSGSTDPGGLLPLVYGWAQTGGPAVALSDPAVVSPTFTAPGDPAVLSFTLTVSNSLGLPSAPDEVVITVSNQPPVADAGPDQGVDRSSTVTLDGSGSTDPDGDLPLAYLWAQTGGPLVALSDPAVVSPNFTAPGDLAVLSFTLTVTDSLGLGSAPDEVVITVRNQPPVADAGPNQSVDMNATVTLDGSGSTDPDGDLPLAYLWTQTGGAAVALSDPAAVAPTFTAPGDPTLMRFTLIVTDGLGLGSTPDEVLIAVGGFRAYLPLVLRSYPPAPPACYPALLASVGVGRAPHGVAVNAAAKRVYVANHDDDTLMVLNSDTYGLVTTKGVGDGPNGVAYNPANDRIYVANRTANTVSVLRASDYGLVGTIPVGSQPNGLAVNANTNRIYVANFGDGTVMVIDGATHEVQTLSAGGGSEPSLVAVNPDTNKAYVSLHGSGRVAVIDSSGSLKTVDIYSGGAYGIAVDALRNLVYVAAIDTFRIAVVDGDMDKFLGWAEIRRNQPGAEPAPLRMVAVNPLVGTSGHVYVTTTGEDGGWNKILLLPKGWPEYFARAYALDLNEAQQGLAFDPATARVFATSRGDNLLAVYLDGEPACWQNFAVGGYRLTVCLANPDGTCRPVTTPSGH